MMNKEGSTKIVIFMTSGAEIFVLGCGHICHYSENVLSSTLSIYIPLIDIVFKDDDAILTYTIVDNFLL